MPLPFIIGGLAALGSAIGGAATVVGTTAAAVGTAAAGAAAAAGTTAAAVGTAAAGAAAAAGTAAVGAAATVGTTAVGAATAVGGSVVSLAAAHPVGAVVATGLAVHAVDTADKDKAVAEAEKGGIAKGVKACEPKLRKQEEEISHLKNDITNMRKRFSREREERWQYIKKLRGEINELRTANKSYKEKLAESEELEKDMIQYMKKLEEEKDKLISKLSSETISDSEREEIVVGIREIRGHIDETKVQLDEVKLLQAS